MGPKRPHGEAFGPWDLARKADPSPAPGSLNHLHGSDRGELDFYLNRRRLHHDARAPIAQDAIDIEGDLIDDMVNKGCA